MTVATSKHLSYWLHPERVRSFGFRKWFAVAVSRSAVRHHFEHKSDDVLFRAERHGLTFNLRNRVVLGFYVEHSQRDWVRVPAPESSLSLAVATDGDVGTSGPPR